MAELVAIADPREETLDFEFDHVVEVFGDAEAMLRGMALDGIIVATPTDCHLAPTLAAVEAGVHVLVEKPISTTLKDAAKIRDAARRCRRRVLVGHHRRHFPSVCKAREIIANGSIGRVVAVSGQWGMRKHDGYYEPGWRRMQAAGPVMINLVHEVDTLRYICGDIVSVSAMTSHELEGLEKEDAAVIAFRFENGALGTFAMSDRVNSPWAWEFATGENPAFPATGQNTSRFMGTAGSLDFPQLVLWKHSEPDGNWHMPIKSREIPHEAWDALDLQVAHFADLIRGKELPRVNVEDAMKSLAVTLAILESAKNGGRPVRL